VVPERLPEEVVDHVDNLAGVNVDQQDIVVIAHPLRPVGRRRQAILPGIADPVTLVVEQRVQEQADREAAVAPVPVGRIIRRQVEDVPVPAAPRAPIVAVVVAPAAIPVVAPVAVAAPAVAPVAVVPVVAPVAPVAIAAAVIATILVALLELAIMLQAGIVGIALPGLRIDARLLAPAAANMPK